MLRFETNRLFKIVFKPLNCFLEIANLLNMVSKALPLLIYNILIIFFSNYFGMGPCKKDGLKEKHLYKIMHSVQR